MAIEIRKIGKKIIQELGLRDTLMRPVLAIREKKYEKMDEAEKKEQLIKWFKRTTGENLDLDNPVTFSQIIQWLKLYNSTPLKTILSDKYLVRNWVADRIGEQHLIPLLGAWDRPQEINIEDLPNSFVLKANHGSGMNYIVKDKSAVNIKQIRHLAQKWLNTPYDLSGMEQQYYAIERKIIAEKYIEQMDGNLYDYKIHCFHGNPIFIQCIGDRDLKKHIGYQNNFDLEWNKLDWTFEDYPNFPYEVSKPKQLNEMIAHAKKLSEDFIYVRVDLYEIDGKVYFGEMTFTPGSGLYPYKGCWTKAQDEKLGSLFKLPPPQ